MTAEETEDQTILWVVTQEDGMYLSEDDYLGPHIYSEPGVECWSLQEDRLSVPGGCYHATLNITEASRWASLEDADRVASEACSADTDGDYWHPVLLSDAESRAGG